MTEKKNEKLLNKYIVTTNSFALNNFDLLINTEVLSTSIFGICNVPNVDVIRVRNLYFIIVHNVYNANCGFSLAAILIKKGNTFSCIACYFGALLANSTSGTNQLISFLKKIPILSTSCATNEIAKTANLHLYANWLNLVSNSSFVTTKYLDAKKYLSDFILFLLKDSEKTELHCSRFLVNILSKLNLVHLFSDTIINFYREAVIGNISHLDIFMHYLPGYDSNILDVGIDNQVLIKYDDTIRRVPIKVRCMFGRKKYTGYKFYRFSSIATPGESSGNLRFIFTQMSNASKFSSELKEQEEKLFVASSNPFPFDAIIIIQSMNFAFPVLRNIAESTVYASLESFNISPKLWRKVHECKFV